MEALAEMQRRWAGGRSGWRPGAAGAARLAAEPRTPLSAQGGRLARPPTTHHTHRRQTPHHTTPQHNTTQHTTLDLPPAQVLRRLPGARGGGALRLCHALHHEAHAVELPGRIHQPDPRPVHHLRRLPRHALLRRAAGGGGGGAGRSGMGPVRVPERRRAVHALQVPGAGAGAGAPAPRTEHHGTPAAGGHRPITHHHHRHRRHHHTTTSTTPTPTSPTTHHHPPARRSWTSCAATWRS